MTTKSKEWLLLNAVECWLYYCDEKLEYAPAYKQLRDELRELVNSKDAPVVERSETPDVPTTPKRTRSRSTK